MSTSQTAAGRDERLAALLGELTEARRRGKPADPDALARQHPDLGDELRALWVAVQLAEEFAPPRSGEPSTLLQAAAPARNAGLEDLPRPFGDFTLLEEIGRGGMGAVYRARQASLHRTVAVKLIHRGERARFQFEAEAAAKLDHPNIVPVHGVGEQDGQPYLCMKYVEGTTLARLVADNPLPPREAARYVAQVARAVHYAHENGILHRDLKPANVLIDRQGRPYVTDFGLAKQVGGPQLTATNAILGTPSYMPPEQASGCRGKLSPASDVYSLGALLYELLTGRPPFRAATPVDTLLLVLDTEPVPPRQLNPRVDRGLELICLKCLQKHADLRYSSAAALADDLDRFLNGETPSVWSGKFADVIGGAFRETHHAAVLENWGLLWMWHSAKAFLQCTATAALAALGVGDRWPYLLIWVVGLLIWCAIFWSLRKRGGPVLFVERVIAHVWGGAVIGTVGVFFVEMLMKLPVLTLSPVLALIGGMVFTVKGGLLSGEFYFHAAAMYLTAVLMVPLMAWYPPAGPMLFGVVVAFCFFQPGLKYYRQQGQRN
jgi:eukaryotic-like serine/threonine-protein kinase